MKLKFILISILIVILTSTSCIFATNKEDLKSDSTNVVDEYFNYTTPKGFLKEVNIEDDFSEITFKKDDLNISLSMYKKTKDNYNACFIDSLEGRNPKNTKVLGLNAKEGFTDLDHLILFEYDNYIIELFANRERTCFTNIEYNKEDEQIFDNFINSLTLK